MKKEWRDRHGFLCEVTEGDHSREAPVGDPRASSAYEQSAVVRLRPDGKSAGVRLWPERASAKYVFGPSCFGL